MEKSEIALIKRCVISCSSDAWIDARGLYVWGSTKHVRFLPNDVREAKKRIAECQAEYQCVFCDAEIHKIVIKRTKETAKILKL